MSQTRAIRSIHKSKPTLEGAGVHLHRAFGNNESPLYDPFLLLDDFRGDKPEDYIEGFPWHPHRGIETITYILDGKVEHGDSLGNSGVIGPGDVQWMTAGSGIIHQEMPQGDSQGKMGGFQLWANLPASDKMMKPRYRGILASQIPIVTTISGAVVRVICGEVDGIHGPVEDIVIEPEYLDITIPGGTEFVHPTHPDHTVFSYIFEGNAFFNDNQKISSNGDLILFSEGDQVQISTRESSARLLLISGKPIREPVAWYGPIVMNTNEELQLAFTEYRNGTFIKP
jgi:quercetin 2,3-dioxygenase